MSKPATVQGVSQILKALYPADKIAAVAYDDYFPISIMPWSTNPWCRKRHHGHGKRRVRRSECNHPLCVVDHVHAT